MQTKKLNHAPKTGYMFTVTVKNMGITEYLTAWQAMKDFTQQRTRETPDEIWLLEHPPVYTQGIAGKPEHLLFPNNIPVIKTDRGGQITYHGPGQIIMYLLLDLHRWQLGIRQLVRKMEGAVINLMDEYDIVANGSQDAPGVYVNGAKIASLGLKIRRGACYHGIAFNADMDLAPFVAINPCGYPGLRVTQAKELGISDNKEVLADKLAQNFIAQLTHRIITPHGR
ncbi:lipoyl(octanoyl) transferase [Nitrosomonas eutropha]|uniref:lipoyl(octanoyl) transferase LipB n=1 Tax=Nitrosomonas eutropha TaxID=916 RepID=UPI000885C6EA|nr:lipoyl(octanoyl) transferase LipB [Nitrosomonas eutropha]SCX07948.1 lipoyl(octanoyl) transferase [Nitrosomonas eutropha]